MYTHNTEGHISPSATTVTLSVFADSCCSNRLTHQFCRGRVGKQNRIDTEVQCREFYMKVSVVSVAMSVGCNLCVYTNSGKYLMIGAYKN